MSLREWASELKVSCSALLLALKHARTPWYAKLLGTFTLLYALSPIDLIPDFIPILGYLDDLILVPLGLWLTIKFIPRDVWSECRAEASKLAKPQKDWRGVILIALIWCGFLAMAYFLAIRK